MRLTDPVIGGGPRVRANYIAFDSFGVKSMCVQVVTPDITLTIDPGASLESASFPLPDDKRRHLLGVHEEACREACGASKAVVISHYHLDHFALARDEVMYGGKAVFAKALDDLPPKQEARARKFHKAIDGLAGEVIWADGRRFKFGRTEVGFTAPVWHGRQHAEPGTVVMTEVKRGKEKLLVTSDVSGPTEWDTTDHICASKAQTVVLDGYPTYQLGHFATDLELVKSIVNVCRILAARGLGTLVIDHHMARDYRYPAFFKLAYDKAKQLGREFGTAAEVRGETSAVLQGYQDYGPTKWRKWAPLEREDARRVLDKAISDNRCDPAWLDRFERWV